MPHHRQTGLRLAGPGRSGVQRGRTLAAPQRQKSRLQAKADGLSTKQTADQLDITDKAAEATFTRARVRMRRLADNFR
jgi:DNA-directed RNA polymerase specialized sigma24 family protein